MLIYKRLSSGISAPVPPAWSPSDLGSALTGWFDAQDGSTFVFNGGNVASWANKGSAGGTASNGTAVQQPAYNATGLNGLPCVSWTAIPQYLTSTVPMTATSFTAFAVFMVDTSVDAFLITSTVSNGWNVFRDNTRARIGGSSNLSSSDINSFPNLTPCLYRFGYQSGVAGFNYVDGVNVNGGAGIITSGGGNLIFGRTSTYTGPGALGEFLWYDGLMSAPDIVLTEAYLNTKWGI